MMIVLANSLKRPIAQSSPVGLLEKTEDPFNGKERNGKAQNIREKYELIPELRIRMLILASKTNTKLIRIQMHTYAYAHVSLFSP